MTIVLRYIFINQKILIVPVFEVKTGVTEIFIIVEI